MPAATRSSMVVPEPARNILTVPASSPLAPLALLELIGGDEAQSSVTVTQPIKPPGGPRRKGSAAL